MDKSTNQHLIAKDSVKLPGSRSYGLITRVVAAAAAAAGPQGERPGGELQEDHSGWSVSSVESGGAGSSDGVGGW